MELLDVLLASGRTIALYRGGMSNRAAVGIHTLRYELGLRSSLGIDDGIPTREYLAESYRNDPGETQALLQKSLCVELDDELFLQDALLRAPFYRVYDISCSDALDTAAKRLPTGKVEVALAADPPKSDTLQLVRLAEQPTEPNDEAQLAPPDGAPTSSSRQLWFRRLASEVQSFNLLIVAESLDDPELWDYLRILRRSRANGRNSSLILTEDSEARVTARAYALGFDVLPVDFSQICQTSLAPSSTAVSSGLRQLERLRREQGASEGAFVVSHALASMAEGSPAFLRGADPTFGDVRDSFSAPRAVVDDLIDQLGPGRASARILLHGKAGAGKSTILMQTALRLNEIGARVGWIDSVATALSSSSLISRFNELDLEFVLVDDVDVWGDSTQRVLNGLSRQGRCRIVCACRSARLGYLRPQMRGFDEIDVSNAGIGHSEAVSIVSLLKRYGMAGALNEFQPFPAAAADEFVRIARGDLLGAMVEVVTGERFDQRIHSEYEKLSLLGRDVYRTLCVFSSLRELQSLREEQLYELCSSFGHPADVASEVATLLGGGELVRRTDGRISARHRAIAERLVESAKEDRSDALRRSVLALLEYFAAIAGADFNHSNPARRALVHLLNHNVMIRWRFDPESIREIYGSVQGLLEHDYHYWLQRAAYEAERGDLDLSLAYIRAGLASEGGGQHAGVITEWGSIVFKMAYRDPLDSRRRSEAADAVEKLADVALRRGRDSPHTFAVLARDGGNWLLAWPEAADAVTVRLTLLERVLDVIERGRVVCGDNSEFLKQADSYEARLRGRVRFLRSNGFPT